MRVFFVVHRGEVDLILTPFGDTGIEDTTTRGIRLDTSID